MSMFEEHKPYIGCCTKAGIFSHCRLWIGDWVVTCRAAKLSLKCLISPVLPAHCSCTNSILVENNLGQQLFQYNLKLNILRDSASVQYTCLFLYQPNNPLRCIFIWLSFTDTNANTSTRYKCTKRCKCFQPWGSPSPPSSTSSLGRRTWGSSWSAWTPQVLCGN